MIVEVDVIIPVHNAADTLQESVLSALNQVIPPRSKDDNDDDDDWLEGLSVHVCCYDDGSTDNSWQILRRLQDEQNRASASKQSDSKQASSSLYGRRIPTELLILKAEDGVARGGWLCKESSC